METKHIEKKSGIVSLITCKCPRCREGDMFKNKKTYSKEFMRMHETCEVCGQYFELEVGFYYGSSYVSYAITVAISIATFIAWWVIIGISYNDNRVIYWLIFNALFLLVLQPWLMRFARKVWLSFFVKYDPEWKSHPAEIPERMNDTHKHGW